MKCKLCSSEKVKIIYNDKIRNGGLGQYTTQAVPIYQCEACNVIWHENVLSDTKEYYESTEYRNSLEGSSEEEKFYELHDKETFEKFRYTGTEIFRNKIVADVGCGCGAFLDFVNGVANTVIAIEPSATYRAIMDRKGFRTYPYAEEAINDYKSEVDVITSFDVIEHVEDPEIFLKNAFELLSNDGQAIIGTPTDAPVMRELLGNVYEQKLLFSTQHLWVFSQSNLRMLAERVGFSDIQIKYYQRYGISNMLGWIKNQKPCGHVRYDFVGEVMDNVYKSDCEQRGLADYIVIYLKK